MLAYNLFKGRHIADNIQAIFEKILTVVTNNAATMVKAFSLYVYEELSDEDEETT